MITLEFSQKKCEIGFLIFIAAFSALFLHISFEYSEISRLIPVMACSATLALVVVRLVQIFMAKEEGKPVKISPKVALFALVLFVGYLGGTYLIGFTIATALFVALVMWFSDYKKPLLILCITVGYVALMYFLFVKVFSVSLPESLIGF
ncbi:tripartite tricarboxylate transporter TctB family protein [Pyramidobacter porci]|uniref:tripartite tricarboxylate transporter TctB family protein n=1 Tax=Pyramidobacter porci TaxID=2605789 RepID=UPI002DD7A3A9|nr:tripartite tricarboxylate transporter TctB family protein [Pyramidobacter porci]